MKYPLLILLILCFFGAAAQTYQPISKKYRNALEKHNKKVDSTTAFFYYERGNIRLDNADYAKAVIDYGKALELEPNNAKIYYNRGIAKIEMNLLTEAIKDFDKTLELEPRAVAYNNRSVCKYMMGNYVGAIQDSSMAILLEPGNAEAHNNRGISKIKLGMKEEGCEDLHKAVELGDKKSKHAIREFCKKK